jgi:hypothetical protein
MPLKKPVELPKVPKTRKKNMDKMKSAVPEKKKDAVEYTIKTYFQYDKVQKKQFYVISLYTVKEFSYLTYEISVNVTKSKNNIEISLLGLNTRQTCFVEAKNAFTDLFFENLFGKYTISFIKQDGSINSFLVDYNIFKKEIIILQETSPKKKNNRTFCTFEVDHSLFSFGKGE